MKRLNRVLPSNTLALLQQAVAIATAKELPLYLVGGPVRDLLLQQPITDLDLVVQGDAWLVAEAFQAVVGGTLTQHARFRTAVVEVTSDDGTLAIDFVTARSESYPAPAALPVVTPSHIHDDLQRRDFTINTLALRLTAPHALLDPFGGRNDIAAGWIRVLHDASFRDDPTRILRAVRFAARFSFALESHTRMLILAALNDDLIMQTTAPRILNELWLLLAEPQPEAALHLLHELGALPQLVLPWTDPLPEQFAAARTANWGGVSLRELYVGLLIWSMTAAQRAAFTNRYNLPAAERKLAHELSRVPLDALRQPQIDAPTLEQLLQPFSIATLRVLQLVAQPPVKQHIAHYVDEIQPLQPLLSGDDLRVRGILPGSHYRALFAELRRAQLNGEIVTREAALHWLATYNP